MKKAKIFLVIFYFNLVSKLFFYELNPTLHWMDFIGWIQHGKG